MFSIFRREQPPKREKPKQAKPQPARDKPAEDCLKSEKLRVERQQFYFDLKENPRGRFLRITEDVNGHRDSIILPVAGLQDFHDVIGRLIEFQDNSYSRSDSPGEEAQPVLSKE